MTRQYPREPPLAFVVPTSDMLVKSSKYVDVSGLCRIEYISNWEKKYEVRSRLSNTRDRPNLTVRISRMAF
jgi:ESCRT-I complex subunit TSG101